MGGRPRQSFRLADTRIKLLQCRVLPGGDCAIPPFDGTSVTEANLRFEPMKCSQPQGSLEAGDVSVLVTEALCASTNVR